MIWCSDRASQLCVDTRSLGEEQSDVPVELQTLLDNLQTGQTLRAAAKKQKQNKKFAEWRLVTQRAIKVLFWNAKKETIASQ